MSRLAAKMNGKVRIAQLQAELLELDDVKIYMPNAGLSIDKILSKNCLTLIAHLYIFAAVKNYEVDDVAQALH